MKGKRVFGCLRNGREDGGERGSRWSDAGHGKVEARWSLSNT